VKMVAISDIAPAQGGELSLKTDEMVWLLGLEDIEPQTGYILNMRRIPSV